MSESRRKLNADDIESTLVGGTALGCGLMGTDRYPEQREYANRALRQADIYLTSLDNYSSHDSLALVTGIGRPSATALALDMFSGIGGAVDLLLRTAQSSAVGVFVGHPGGFLNWIAASRTGLDVVDLAANGRGHPTAAMGAMGLAGDNNARITQTVWFEPPPESGAVPVSAVFTTSHTLGEKFLRYVAHENGGAIMAARGLYEVGFLKSHAALGAMSFQQRIGEALLSVSGGDERIAQLMNVVEESWCLKGRIQSVRLEPTRDAFLAGILWLETERGPTAILICNEVMGVDVAGTRISTFPDLHILLNRDGEPLAARACEAGKEVVIVGAPHRSIPLGSGVWDASVYPQVEQALGQPLARHVLAAGED